MKIGRKKADIIHGGKREERKRFAHDDHYTGMKAFHRKSYARDQTTAPDRDHHSVYVRHLLHDLEAERSLSRHNVRMIVPVYRIEKRGLSNFPLVITGGRQNYDNLIIENVSENFLTGYFPTHLCTPALSPCPF